MSHIYILGNIAYSASRDFVLTEYYNNVKIRVPTYDKTVQLPRF